MYLIWIGDKVFSSVAGESDHILGLQEVAIETRTDFVC